MNILLLGGANPVNRVSMEVLRDSLVDAFEAVEVYHYHHWKSPGGALDLDVEVDALSRAAEELGSFAVFARSEGTLLALKAISSGFIAPPPVVYVGTPVYPARRQGLPIDDWLSSDLISGVFIQHTHDPVIGADELKALHSETSQTWRHVEAIPGTGHNYCNVPLLRRVIVDYAS